MLDARARPAAWSSAAAGRSSSSPRCSRSRAASPCPATRRARAAIAQLTKALANEWAPHGVNVNADRAGLHRDRQHAGAPAGRGALAPDPRAHPGRPLGRAARTSQARSSSSPRRPPTTCTASCCPSTAGGSRGDRGRASSGSRRAPDRPGADRRGTPRGRARMPGAARRRAARSPKSPSAPTPQRTRFGASSRDRRLLVGAGTVLPPEQARAARSTPARVSPSLPERTHDVIAAAAEARRARSSPGSRPPTEIERARRARAATSLKLFPASAVGGPAFVRRSQPVYPGRARFVPTGGVDAGEPRLLPRLPSVLACRRHVDLRRARCSRGTASTRSSGGRARRSSWRRGRGVSVSRSGRGGLPLRPRRARRGHAPLRSRRGPDRDRAHVRRLRGRWRVQRRPRAAPLLRSAHRDRHGVRRQPRRPAARGPDPAGRRRPGVRRAGCPYDGIGRSVRNGLNFVERGFGVRRALGVSDRGHSAASQLRPGDVDWDAIFGRDGARWFHCGGIFAALAPNDAPRWRSRR